MGIEILKMNGAECSCDARLCHNSTSFYHKRSVTIVLLQFALKRKPSRLLQTQNWVDTKRTKLIITHPVLFTEPVEP